MPQRSAISPPEHEREIRLDQTGKIVKRDD